MTQLDEPGAVMSFWTTALVKRLQGAIKPIIAEARSQALEEAANVCSMMRLRPSHEIVSKLRKLAADARKEGAA